ncbi:hypothetical protein KQH54_03880 [bacterium]|nr:hypothetical protein [bacterium]
MENLWKDNSPQNFWQLSPPIQDEVWQQAVERAYPILGLKKDFTNITGLYSQVLGEAQFGESRYELGMTKRIYYQLKPVLPRILINLLKKISSKMGNDDLLINWPAEDRYALFLWECLQYALNISGQTSIQFKHFWPDGKQFAFVLTHDVETAAGQAFIRKVADLEEMIGFRSSFNFVPERYPLDHGLMQELRERGFEIGVHGLKHDGKLFFSQAKFAKRAAKINQYLDEFGSVGFRTPLMHRNPEWMQALNLEYDLSVFDTDPYEPVPGGTMSLWPFSMGKFIELPYTLVQDSTFRYTLEETSPQLWLDKVEFLKKFYGMALLNSHPDYLKDEKLLQIYGDFLRTIKKNGGFWHALPKEVSAWWKSRQLDSPSHSTEPFTMGRIQCDQGKIQIA